MFSFFTGIRRSSHTPRPDLVRVLVVYVPCVFSKKQLKVGIPERARPTSNKCVVLCVCVFSNRKNGELLLCSLVANITHTAQDEQLPVYKQAAAAHPPQLPREGERELHFREERRTERAR